MRGEVTLVPPKTNHLWPLFEPKGPETAPPVFAAPRSVRLFELASTKRILHCGQTAETISMSRSISCPQPVLPDGSGVALPLWFTFLKQPDATVHGGNPNWLR